MINKENVIIKDMFQPAHIDPSKSEKIAKPSLNFWQDAWLRVRKNKGAVTSMIILAIIIIMAFVGPMLTPYDFDHQNTKHNNLPPRIQGLENIHWLPFDGTLTRRNGTEYNAYEARKIDAYYWFGTDSLGRDIFARVWKGTQISLLIAFLAAVIDMIIGVTYGAISGYIGGRVDSVMQRIIEVLVGIPNLIIVVLMILVLKPGIIPIVIALTITGWTSMARVVRAQVLKFKNQEFVLASKTLGASDTSIVFKHMIPNMFGVIIINTMFSIPNAIFFEAFLSFIGLGLQEPFASLGTLVDDGFKSMIAFPYQMIIPSIMIALIMVCFNLVADGLRDALDPKMRD
ncbi:MULTISPECIES: oligopeptide ABC transporter permease [Neobacillus]|jgi:oligopeptide transport system permease protein|uniref:ABC transporter permease n=1 Tax=Neobacillus sedimentimangrovi TaxID=2699460 RepID=A0ABS8QEU8_9BACI|nr:oligopeptide ABC transporter permease [Neobacillus sedimentimangrovi]AIM17432.1 peptide ABC transporter permease [Bacillus sp. X1(2014)]MCD4837748.1 ABC transporter permease [Neobacillus sedimentimangrovi]